MKSIRIHEHGGIDKLIYEDVPEPTISSENVIVKDNSTKDLNINNYRNFR